MTPRRDDEVTITLTAEEWDSLGYQPHTSYASNLRSNTMAKITAVNRGAGDRYDAARAEAFVHRPILTAAVKREIRAHTRSLVKLHRAGTLQVDHLGHGDDAPRASGGFSVTIIPRIQNGGAALHFRMRDVWFDGTQFSLEPTECDWFIKLARRHVEVLHTWGGSGNWLGVAFE